MPYKNEVAGKGGHSDIVKNPDIADFLKHCSYMKTPSEEEAAKIVSSFISADVSTTLPALVIASDASKFSDPIQGKFPSTQIGYVKVSLVCVKVEDFNGLVSPNSHYVDPFKVAEMHKNAGVASFVLPGSNITYKNASSVTNGFRLAVYESLSSNKTVCFPAPQDYSLKNFLHKLNDIANSPLLLIKNCPSCNEILHPTSSEGVVFSKANEVIQCPHCSEHVYCTDALRLHEDISDFGENTSSITRFMNAVEHLIVAAFINYVADINPKVLSDLAFIVDGPLAIFGQPARLHSRLMAFYHNINQTLKDQGFNPPIIMGLQKTGQVMEHAQALSQFIKPNTYRLVDDDYRFLYIKGGSLNTGNFGHETYYGQDFIYKTKKGSIFVLGIPYPFEKKLRQSDFAKQKISIDCYASHLKRAFKIIEHFEFDLYENSVIPIALAHRHASISLTPGGKVLEILSRKNLG